MQAPPEVFLKARGGRSSIIRALLSIAVALLIATTIPRVIAPLHAQAGRGQAVPRAQPATPASRGASPDASLNELARRARDTVTRGDVAGLQAALVRNRAIATATIRLSFGGSGTLLAEAILSPGPNVRGICEMLIAAGAPVNPATPGQSSLRLAVARRDWERGVPFFEHAADDLLGLLLDRGAVVPSTLGSTPGIVFQATLAGMSAASIERLLAKGADANAAFGSFAPLHVAAMAGNADVVKTLLAHGARVDTRTAAGATPLVSAVLGPPSAPQPDFSLPPIADGRDRVIALLLDAGASATAPVGNTGLTVLHVAALRSTPAAIARILTAGADVNAVSATGETPTDLARSANRPDIVSELVARGAPLPRPAEIVPEPPPNIRPAAGAPSVTGGPPAPRRVSVSERLTRLLDPLAELPSPFNPGTDGFISDILLQSDGTMLVAGSFKRIGAGKGRFAQRGIARLFADGRVDQAFDAAVQQGPVSRVVRRLDGSIVIGGAFGISDRPGPARSSLAQLTKDGLIDSSFAPQLTGWVFALALQDDGRLLVGGNNVAVGGALAGARGLGRLNTDGTADPSFQPAVTGTVQAIAIQPDGRVLVAGTLTVIGTPSPPRAVLRLLANGALDPDFTSINLASGSVTSVTLQPDGKILVGGYFTVPGRQFPTGLVRLMPTGVLDAGFAPDVKTQTVRVVLARDGTVLAAGGSGIQRFSDRGVEIPFVRLYGLVSALVEQPDGKFVVGGSFEDGVRATVNGTIPVNLEAGAEPGFRRKNLLRVNADGTLESSSIGEAGGMVTALAPGGGSGMVVAGTFTGPNAVNGFTNWHYVARMTASGEGGSLIATLNRPATALASQPDGKIIMAGGFSLAPVPVLGGPAPVTNICRVNADGTLDVSFRPTAFNSLLGVSGLVVQSDGRILAGGDFQSLVVSGNRVVQQRFLVRLQPDGALDSSFTTNVDGAIVALIRQSDGKVLVAGDFQTIGQVSMPRMARLEADGSVDRTFVRVPSNPAAMTLDAAGRLLVVGESSSATRFFGMIVGHPLAPDGRFDQLFSQRVNGTITAVAAQDDGVVVAGDFTRVGDRDGRVLTETFHLARMDADGTVAATTAIPVSAAPSLALVSPSVAAPPLQTAAAGLAELQAAAAKGDAAAQDKLGLLYASGTGGVARDYETAVSWLRKSAEQGNIEAQFNLGVAYANGLGVTSDPIEAHKWLNLAAFWSSAAQDVRDAVSARMSGGALATARARSAEWLTAFERPVRQAPPPGYLWESTVLPHTSFLRPDGWYFRREDTGATFSYFISRQPIPPDSTSGDDVFDVGVTINVIRRVGPQANGGATPSAFVRQLVEAVKADTKVRIERSEAIAGLQAGFDMESLTTTAKGAAVRMRTLLVGDDATETVLLVAFETPVDQWAAMRVTADPVLSAITTWLRLWPQRAARPSQ